MDWERLGLAWAGANAEDVRKASRQAIEDSEARLSALEARQRLRAAMDEPGETYREMLKRRLGR